MRVPTRSEGTRSGVNWTRWKVPPSTLATVAMVSVLARPGTPSSSRWLLESSATKTRSSIPSWPTITRLISNNAASSRECAAAASPTAASRGLFSVTDMAPSGAGPCLLCSGVRSSPHTPEYRSACVGLEAPLARSRPACSGTGHGDSRAADVDKSHLSASSVIRHHPEQDEYGVTEPQREL